MNKKYVIKVIVTNTETGEDYVRETKTADIWTLENLASDLAYGVAETISDEDN